MKSTGVLIGCGAISKKHLKAFFDNRDSVELTAVCDVSMERAEALAAEYQKMSSGLKLPLVFSDHRKMLEAVKPTVAAIATSSSYHYSIAMDCMECGIHVIIEKPMALSSGESKALIEKARSSRLKLSVCYITRFAPHIQHLYNAVRDGRFGRLYYGSMQVRWNRNDDYYRQTEWRGTWDKDGGMMMNQGTHGMDLLLWLLNQDLVRVSGVIRNFVRPIESEDFAAATLEFSEGTVGIVEASVLVYPGNLESSLSLFGEKGTVVIGGNHIDTVKVWQFADGKEPSDLESARRLFETESREVLQGHSCLYKDFLSAINNGHDPLISGEEGYKSVEAILAIYKSVKEFHPVELPIVFDTCSMKDTLIKTIGGKQHAIH